MFSIFNTDEADDCIKYHKVDIFSNLSFRMQRDGHTVVIMIMCKRVQSETITADQRIGGS